MLKVSCLAMVSSLTILCSAWRYFCCVVSRAFSCWFVWECVFPPSSSFRYLGIVGGCYSLACLQSSGLILFASCFFIPLFQWFSSLLLLLLLFYFSLFDRLPLNVFRCDWCPCLCCLILVCLSLCWGGGSWLGCGFCWP